MQEEYSIGVVTYLGRFESYFKPLIKRLCLLFPDRDINVWINGHHNQARQIEYLKKITTFLNEYSNVKYVTNFEHQALSNGFNWLILLSECDRILILNDDVQILSDFRHNFEGRNYPCNIFTINRTWSHFVISKEVVKKAGWFDERLRGIGFEDTDYAIRLSLQGIQLGDVKIHGVYDRQAPPEDASWAKISEPIRGKYSQVNWEFFQKKWGVQDQVTEPQEGVITMPAVGMVWHLKPEAAWQEVPEFYPLEALDGAANRRVRPAARLAGNGARAVSRLGSYYWQARLAMGHWLHRLLGRRRKPWRQAES